MVLWFIVYLGTWVRECLVTASCLCCSYSVSSAHARLAASRILLLAFTRWPTYTVSCSSLAYVRCSIHNLYVVLHPWVCCKWLFRFLAIILAFCYCRKFRLVDILENWYVTIYWIGNYLAVPEKSGKYFHISLGSFHCLCVKTSRAYSFFVSSSVFFGFLKQASYVCVFDLQKSHHRVSPGLKRENLPFSLYLICPLVRWLKRQAAVEWLFILQMWQNTPDLSKFLLGRDQSLPCLTPSS